MRKPVLLAVVFVAALLAIGIVQASASSATLSSPKGIATPPPGVAAATPPPGVAAIAPTQAGVPAFTVADVQRYLATAPFPGGRTLSGAAPATVQILFVPKEQAEVLMHGESLDELPAGTLVCYVELQGPFSSAAVHKPRGAKNATFQTGLMVFDARTGNLVAWGLI